MFKDRLCKILSDRGISRSQLSAALGYSPQAVSNWTLGKSSPDPDTLSKIADYFNCSTDYLLGRVDYPELVIKKAPPESGADVGNYAVNKGSPEFTAEEILRLKELLQNQGNSSGE